MRWNKSRVLTAGWVAAGTCLYLVAPLSAPIVLALAVAAPILLSPRGALLRDLRAWSLPVLCLAAACIYLLINTTWSLTPVLAYRNVAMIAVAAIVLHVIARTMPSIGREDARAMAAGFYAGYAASALFLSVEILFENPVRLSILRLFPELIPRERGMVVANGVVERLPEFFLNHRMAALAFLIWPALLVASRLGNSLPSRATLVACLSPAVVAIAASAHETSKVALAGSAAVASGYMLAPRLVKPALAAAWIVACVAVVPVATMAYDMKLQLAEWLPLSARHRIVIWGVTSGQVADAPVLGHGVGSAREIKKEYEEQPTYEPGTPFKQSTGLHAHNAYLQVWFETGAVGAALLLGIGLAILGAISRMPAQIQAALYAAFAGNALLAASSFSVWASWFVASHALTAVMAMLAWRLSETGRPYSVR